jgi:hypothetical protein
MNLRSFAWQQKKSLFVLVFLTAASAGVAASDRAHAAPHPLSEAREAGEIRLALSNADLAAIGSFDAWNSDNVDAASVELLGFRATFSPGRVEGFVRTAAGRVEFRSTLLLDGRVRIEHTLAGKKGTLALVVDRLARRAEPEFPVRLNLTASDRFALRALALALEKQLAASPFEASAEADLLLRATRLWGDHPLETVRLRSIEAPLAKSWTNLCGVTTANLAHDATSHGLLTERLATGPNASNCRARCGAGCTAILGTSAWTVDCGEHDRCEQTHSCCVSCQDEFNSASDDYLFASNCRLSGW